MHETRAVMKLTDPKKTFPIEDKRFYIPHAKIEGECPNCHKPITHHFGKNYLAYPTANAVNTVHLYCDKCEHEWDVEVRLDVSLSLVKS